MIRRLLARWRNRGCPINHPFHGLYPTGLDYRGLPTAQCPCGSRMFYAALWLDTDDYTVGGYVTDGLCGECGALVTLATEIDHPNYEEA